MPKAYRPNTLTGKAVVLRRGQTAINLPGTPPLDSHALWCFCHRQGHGHSCNLLN